ncbi:hypothetical protein [Nocardia sp. CNY236]|uniref:hypothetical protein n=1 Tax=Nocardia sp. CNY236 TaxID=1169152 RepID=UPI000421B310|nr:hypothetical protein [Nocardia sp. CNY236]
MAQLPHQINGITDDSCVLGIVDPHTYTSFVDDAWSWKAISDHFRSEMGRRTLLLWGTGAEHSWRIDLSASPVDPRWPITRQTSGPISVSGGELVVVSWEVLAAAAIHKDEPVDVDKETCGTGIDLPNGNYVCTITQHNRPERGERHGGPDFHLQLVPGEARAWTGRAWRDEQSDAHCLEYEM